MKNLYILTAGLVLLCMVACEPRQDVFGEGMLASPYHDCSIMQYLRNDPYNWDLTVEMIERGGLTDLFEGEVDSLPEITFLGFTKFSVMRYIWDAGQDSVAQLGVTECRDMVLRHVIKGKHLKSSIAYQSDFTLVVDENQKVGTDLVTLKGNRLRFYQIAEDYFNVPQGGAWHMLIWSFTANVKVPTGSCDIQPLNGVVHSLGGNYNLGRI